MSTNKLADNTSDTSVKKGDSVAKSAMMVMIAMIVSRILGYLRDVIIYAQIGQNNYTDAYNAAFKIPDCIYMILVGGALSAAFIPVISRYLAKGEKDKVWEFTGVVISVISVLLLIFVAVAYIFTPQFISFYVSGFDEETLNLTILLTRIMLLQCVFMALAGICQGILQSFKWFTPTAVGSVVYNVGIILVGAIFSGIIEKHFPGFGITAFSIGVVAGAFGSFAIQAVSLKKVGMKFKPSFNIHHPGFKEMILLMLPVFISIGSEQLNLFVNAGLASHLESGLLSALNQAQRLEQLPVSIFAVSIAMAVFPVLSREAALEHLDNFKKEFVSSINTILFIMIPFSLMLVVLGVPFIRLLYQIGKFSATNTQSVAYALYFYSIGIFAYGCIQVLNRSFYAFHETRKPVFIAVCSVAINLILSFTLVKVLDHAGLALAYSTAGICHMLLLFVFLKRMLPDIGIRNIIHSAFKTLICAVVMAVFTWFASYGCEALLGVETKITQLIQFGFSGCVGLVVFLLMAKLLRMPELDAALGAVLRKFRRKKA